MEEEEKIHNIPSLEEGRKDTMPASAEQFFRAPPPPWGSTSELGFMENIGIGI